MLAVIPVADGNVVDAGLQNSTLHKIINLARIGRYAIFFWLLLLWLPLRACDGAALHTLLGGLFIDLSWWQLFFTIMVLALATANLAVATALLFDGEELRWARRAGFERHNDLPAESCLTFRSVADEISFPISFEFFAISQLPALAGAIVLVSTTTAPQAWAASTLALLLVYGMILSLNTSLGAIQRARVLPPKLSAHPPELFAFFIERLLRWQRRLVWERAWVAAFSRKMFRDVVDEEGVLRPEHAIACAQMFGFTAVYAFLAWFFYPTHANTPTTAIHLFLLIGLLISAGIAAQFYLAPMHIGPLLIPALVIISVTSFCDVDHYFPVDMEERTSSPLTPFEVVRAAEGPNLVVVAASGGGISAASWTTLALHAMIAKRPELAREIRLVSAVSGGSVGAAFLLQALSRYPDPVDASWVAHRNAVKTSLGDVGFGLVHFDFWRPFVPFAVTWTDRGHLQDARWQANADKTDRLMFSTLRPQIRRGTVPAPIFNATAMETGERVMITPIEFGTSVTATRAPTLSELLHFEAVPRPGRCSPAELVDRSSNLSGWTAARLSATFPYISPAARPRVTWKGVDGDCEFAFDGRSGQHLIDGGYFDNYGVASSLEWLDHILTEKERGGLEQIRCVLILRLEAFPRRTTSPVSPALLASVIGPLVGLYNIRDTAALTRNDAETDRFMKGWESRLPTIRLANVVIRPPVSFSGPLSWHLTTEQHMEQLELFRCDNRSCSEPIDLELREAFDRALAFLAKCPRP